MKNKILTSEQYIFHTPLEEWKDKTTNQLDDWLTKYTPVIRQSLRLAKKHTKENTQDLRNFYTTATLPVAPPSAKPRRTRKPKQPRRSLVQRTLENQRVREHMTQSRPIRPKHTKNAPSTNIIKEVVRMKPLSSFFPPRDKRAEHRKSKVRDRVNSEDFISGGSNNIPE